MHNDRAGEVGRTLNAKDFDLDRIFGKEGVQIVHLSGLIGALAGNRQVLPRTGPSGEEIRRPHLVRPELPRSFWKGREKELHEIFSEIAGVADFLVGNEEDFQLSLGIEGPEEGGKDLAAKIEGFKVMIDRVKKTYPNASVFATTLRQVINANCHLWGVVMAACNEWHVIQPREITVLDRIGGGDGFVGGLLHAVLRGWPPEKWVQFGWACGAGHHATDRLRPTGRRRTGVEHLERQRQGAAIGHPHVYAVEIGRRHAVGRWIGQRHPLGDVLEQNRPVQPFYVRSHLVWETAELAAVRQLLAAMASPRLAELVVLDLPADDLYGDHWSVTGRGSPAADAPDTAMFLPGRNPLLLVKPALWCGLHGIEELAVAVLATNPFGDATPEFFRDFQAVLFRATGVMVRLSAPFARMTKSEVMALGRHLPLDLTFCCISPVAGLHCGRCNKCRERIEAFRGAGREDRTRYASGTEK